MNKEKLTLQRGSMRHLFSTHFTPQCYNCNQFKVGVVVSLFFKKYSLLRLWISHLNLQEEYLLLSNSEKCGKEVITMIVLPDIQLQHSKHDKQQDCYLQY